MNKNVTLNDFRYTRAQVADTTTPTVYLILEVAKWLNNSNMCACFLLLFSSYLIPIEEALSITVCHTRLPDDVRFNPPIGNGHVATNVLSDTIYMNGLFNGHEDYSSRARIQSTVSVDFRGNANKRYTLNMYEGVVLYFFII